MKAKPIHICSNPAFDVFTCLACEPDAEPIAKDIPVCKCGARMVLYLLDSGLARIGSWRCPKRHFWNKHKHKHNDHVYAGTF